MTVPEYTEPNSPVARVLSGNYTLIVRHDREGGRIEHVTTGEQFDAFNNEVAELLAYKCVRVIDRGAGGVRYGTVDAGLAWWSHQ